MNETYDVWRDIPGYEGKYQASIDGRVRSMIGGRPRVLTPYVKKANGSARFIYHLRWNDKDVQAAAQIIMRDTFMGGFKEGFDVVHINGLKSDNRLDNLRYVAKREVGKLYGGLSSRRPVRKIDREGNVVAIYPSARQAGVQNHMSYQTVLDRCHGRVMDPFALDDHDYRFDDAYFDRNGKPKKQA